MKRKFAAFRSARSSFFPALTLRRMTVPLTVVQSLALTTT